METTIRRIPSLVLKSLLLSQEALARHHSRTTAPEPDALKRNIPPLNLLPGGPPKWTLSSKPTLNPKPPSPKHPMSQQNLRPYVAPSKPQSHRQPWDPKVQKVKPYEAFIQTRASHILLAWYQTLSPPPFSFSYELQSKLLKGGI